MTYSGCREYIGGLLGKADFSDVDDCLLQLHVIGADGGTFYIDIKNHEATLSDEADGKYAVKYVFTPTVLSRLLQRVIDPVYGYAAGKYKMMGDVKLGRQVLTRIIG